MLPIDAIRDEFMSLLAGHQVLIICGPTGSGKSTKIPLFAMEYVLSQDRNLRVVCTQIRRTATIAISNHVRTLAGNDRDLVGHLVRFDNRMDHQSRLVFMTEGVLFNSAVHSFNSDINFIDKSKRNSGVGIGAVILDEVHERTLTMDVLLSALLKSIKIRPHLRLILMSATADVEFWSRLIPDSRILVVPGSQYNISITYLPETPPSDSTNIVRSVLSCLEKIMVDVSFSGNILVFVPGKREIDVLMRKIERLNFHNCVIFPFHSGLTSGEQQKAIETGDFRKIIVATNAAETAITFPNVDVVIDSGLARTEGLDFHNGVNYLLQQPIPKSAAQQRAGRTGRTRDGAVFRLYSLDDYNNRRMFSEPAIMRSDLASLCLQLHAYGCDEISQLNLIQMPDPLAINRAHQIVRDLGAIELDYNLDRCEISQFGYYMSYFRTTVEGACSLVFAMELGVFKPVAAMFAMLSAIRSGSNPISHDRHKYITVANDNSWDFRGDHFRFEKIMRITPVDIAARKAWCLENKLDFDAITLALEIYNQFCCIFDAMNETEYNNVTEEMDPVGYERRILSALFRGHRNKVAKYVYGKGFVTKHISGAVIQYGSVLARRPDLQYIIYDDIRIFDDDNGQYKKLIGCTAVPNNMLRELF